MNDKIDALLAQLKNEIENYVQTEVASRTSGAQATAAEFSVDAYTAPDSIPPVSVPESSSSSFTALDTEDSNSVVSPSLPSTSTSFTASPSEVSNPDISLGATPIVGETTHMSTSSVSVPPMPEPTAVDSNPVNNLSLGQEQLVPGEETRSFSEEGVFSANQVTDQQGENSDQNLTDSLSFSNDNPVSPDPGLPFAAPDFTMPAASTAVDVAAAVPAVDLAAFSENQDTPETMVNTDIIGFKMPTNINHSGPDAFNGPINDLPDPGSSPTSSSDVSVDDALADLPSLDQVAAANTNANSSLPSSVFSNSAPSSELPAASPELDLPISDLEQTLPAPAISSFSNPSSSRFDSDLSTPDTPEFSNDLPLPIPPSDFAVPTSSSDGLDNSPTTPVTESVQVNQSGDVNQSEPGFSKAKGLLNRVLKKEWGKQ